ncbi:MAG TPA: hypothetical protein PLD74_11380 [Prolixibacteraceae bacterium]|jgi:hypothetical protein|nr:hypothetical protein [Paludibacter sp.]HOS91082.1 hypothetical protein [Prolixibacteraceae bacterium]HQE52951.1 hypothetical protein [Prolixibacteraceae bacterium]HQH77048.1 hypothetical protein [Prolixibacteraceae bacterium]HQJ86303.1 hypothetical protein [Prolixibacteraceae bacterium]
MKNLNHYLLSFLFVLNLQASQDAVFSLAGIGAKANTYHCTISKDADSLKKKSLSLINDPQAEIEFWNPKPVVIWTYQHQLIFEDGRNGNVDYARTAEAMQDLGATAIFQPIKTQQQYNNLIYHLEQIKNTDIRIIIQTGHNCVLEAMPGSDCVQVVKNLANLSLQYPNLVGICLDDLHPTRTNKTPEEMNNLIEAKNSINPKFLFLPTLYYDVWDELQFFREGNPFNGVFKDGSFMWYWASYGEKGRTVNINTLQNYVNEAKSIFPPAHFITGIYTQKDGILNESNNVDIIFHKPNELRRMIELGYIESDGLGLFNIPLYMYDVDHLLSSTIFKQQSNNDPAYNYRLTNSEKGTFASWYQAIETDISVAPGSRVRVKFDMRDTRNTGDAGYLYKQLLVNDKVLWEEDITISSLKATIDKVIQVQEGNAKIVVRVFSKRANWISANAYVSTPIVCVNDQEVPASWKFNGGMSKLNEYKQVYDIIKGVIKGTPQTTIQKIQKNDSPLNLMFKNGNLYCNDYSGSIQVYLYNINGQLIYMNNRIDVLNGHLLVDVGKFIKSNTLLFYKILNTEGRFGSGKILIY